MDLRQSGIGGSDVGVVLGMSKYKTPLQLFNEKCWGAEDFSSLPAELGSFLEPFLRKKMTESGELEILDRGCGMIFHKEHNFLFANPDDIGRDQYGFCIVEYKTTALHNAKHWKDGQLPQVYWAQVQLYMQVMASHFGYDEFQHAKVVVLFGNRNIETRLVSRDDYWFENTALPALERFWGTVQKKDPESFWLEYAEGLDGSAEVTKAVNQAFVPEEKSDEVVELNAGAEAFLTTYALAKENYEIAKERFEAVKNKIKVVLKDVQKAETNRYRVTWPVISGRPRLDQGALKADHPELYSKYTKQGSQYRGALTIKEK